MAITIRVKRGTDAQRLGYTPLLSELVYAEDTKELYIGDGVQIGGIPINGNYINKNQINVANGVAGLDAGGKLDTSLLPALSITDVKVVADIAARDALASMESGDTAIVTDADGNGNPKTFIMDSAGVWQEMKVPAGGVLSVAGRVGTVTLTTADLTNFNLGTPTDGQVISWDNATSKWVSKTAPSGVTKFTQLTDVGTPASNGGKLLVLNASGTAVDYTDTVDGGTI
jgi:hypothetical protein